MLVDTCLTGQSTEHLKGCEACNDARVAGNFFSVALLKDRSTKKFFLLEVRMFVVLYRKTFEKGAHFLSLRIALITKLRMAKLLSTVIISRWPQHFGYGKCDADYCESGQREFY